MTDAQPCLAAAPPGWRAAIAEGDGYEMAPVVAWALCPDDGYAGGFRPCALVARASSYRDAPNYLELVDDGERFVVYLEPGVTPESIELDEILRDVDRQKEPVA